jgi:hypothetical protein
VLITAPVKLANCVWAASGLESSSKATDEITSTLHQDRIAIYSPPGC